MSFTTPRPTGATTTPHVRTGGAPSVDEPLAAAKEDSEQGDLSSQTDAACRARRPCGGRRRGRKSRSNNQSVVSPGRSTGLLPTRGDEQYWLADTSVLPLVVGVSTRALFNCEDEHRVFAQDGEAAYCALQREREASPLCPGCAFELVKRLLALNSVGNPKLVDVVLLSRNKPDQALRIFKSCEAHGLAIVAGSFTGGRSVVPYARAWDVDLFLSNDDEDVRAALAVGVAAARLALTPSAPAPTTTDEVHFALDGDAVTFNSESESIFRKSGLLAFERHEQVNARSPLAPGPFGGPLLRKLLALRSRTRGADGENRIRISMVTAREAPAHERALRTLRHWGALFDEIHFVGHRTKAPFLAAAGALIFFDDREAHVEAASRFVVAGHVPEVGGQPQCQLVRIRGADRVSAANAK